MYKPSELFLGIIDFFAIIIPGGVITLSIYYYYSADIDKIAQLTESQSWVAIFCVSYFIGNIISFMGERIDKIRPINKYINKGFTPIWQCLDAIRNELHPTSEREAINIYQWCRSVLIAVSPESMADVNRAVAASDFFRNLYILFPIIGIISLINQDFIFGIALILLTIPCLFISAYTRLNLLKRIGQHVIVLYRLGRLNKEKTSDT
jgi:hypothetical protein